jgi:imidazolonepropionase-like amidohydrolase
VNVVLGDDYGAAIQPHGTYGKEPAFYVDVAGIDPLVVLKWATVNGGKLVGLPDLGRIEEGYLADIVLVNGDPAEDIHVLGEVDNIVAVMRDGGIWIDNLERRARLARDELIST